MTGGTTRNAHFVVHAAELMQQPRRHGGMCLSSEATFTVALRETANQAARYGLEASLVQLLTGAWQRLQRSGMLESRRIEKGMRMDAISRRAIDAAVQKSLTATGLRSCALDGCGAKEAHPAHFKSCAACRTVVYCCREHQVAGWPVHMKACKAAHKAAAAGDDGAAPSCA